MMGSSLPYHLRTNKSIERQIFLDLLYRLDIPEKIQTYKYISLGGPMLDDHQSLHNQLGLTQLESLERDKAAFSRQEFNKPFGCIKCIKTTIKDYVLQFNEQGPVIIWFDYVAIEWKRQFEECYDLLVKLKENDIFKVTFNANPDTLQGESKTDRLEYFLNKADSQYLSDNLTENDVLSMDRLSKTIVSTFNSIVDDALDVSSELKYHPLTMFRYIDNRHHMITITGIVLSREKENCREDLIKKSHLHSWPNLSEGWGDIHEINVPDLTARERALINQMLPCDNNEEIYNHLPFFLDANKKRSIKAIDNYIKYYRYMPHFQKIVS